MRLPGDTACFVELADASVLPSLEDEDQRPFTRGARALVVRASRGEWSVTVRGGVALRPLLVGDRITVSGVRSATGERFALPEALECTEVDGDGARFAPPRARRAQPRWEMAF